MNKMMFHGILIALTVTLAMGCNNPEISEPPDLHQSDDEFRIEQTQPLARASIQNIGAVPYRYSFNEILSEQVAEMENIAGAVVLLDEEHNAYIAVLPAIDFKRKYVRAPYTVDPQLKIKTTEPIPAPVQVGIADRVRQSDSEVRRIYLTDNLEHYQRLQQASTQSRGTVGVQNKGQTTPTTDPIQEIWQTKGPHLSK